MMWRMGRRNHAPHTRTGDQSGTRIENVFGWKLMNNGLATQENKKHRSIITMSTCEVCGMEEESVVHAVARCGHVVALREAMRKVWSLPDEEQYLCLTTRNLLPLLDHLSTDEAARVLLLLWRSSQVRNNITHSSEKLSIVGSVRFLQKYWAELCSIRYPGSDSNAKGKQHVC